MDRVFAGKGKRRVMVGRWKKECGVTGIRITQKNTERKNEIEKHDEEVSVLGLVNKTSSCVCKK